MFKRSRFRSSILLIGLLLLAALGLAFAGGGGGGLLGRRHSTGLRSP